MTIMIVEVLRRNYSHRILGQVKKDFFPSSNEGALFPPLMRRREFFPPFFRDKVLARSASEGASFERENRLEL